MLPNERLVPAMEESEPETKSGPGWIDQEVLPSPEDEGPTLEVEAMDMAEGERAADQWW